MDRRGFFKKLFVTPFLAPLLLSSDSNRSTTQLYVIGDSPQLVLPSLLRGLNTAEFIKGRTVTFLNSHPEAKKLRSALSVHGWIPAVRPSNADLSISFQSLRDLASPSFTLIRNAKVWDIRTKELYSLWRDMYRHHPASSLLTTVFFKNMDARPHKGTHANVFLGGINVESLPLDNNISRSYRLEKGKISLTVNSRNVWVSDSSCRHKICSSAPAISLTGERIICAPNNFLIEIQGSRFVDTVIG